MSLVTFILAACNVFYTRPGAAFGNTWQKSQGCTNFTQPNREREMLFILSPLFYVPLNTSTSVLASVSVSQWRASLKNEAKTERLCFIKPAIYQTTWLFLTATFYSSRLNSPCVIISSPKILFMAVLGSCSLSTSWTCVQETLELLLHCKRTQSQTWFHSFLFLWRKIICAHLQNKLQVFSII